MEIFVNVKSKNNFIQVFVAKMTVKGKTVDKYAPVASCSFNMLEHDGEKMLIADFRKRTTVADFEKAVMLEITSLIFDENLKNTVKSCVELMIKNRKIFGAEVSEHEMEEAIECMEDTIKNINEI